MGFSKVYQTKEVGRHEVGQSSTTSIVEITGVPPGFGLMQISSYNNNGPRSTSVLKIKNKDDGTRFRMINLRQRHIFAPANETFFIKVQGDEKFVIEFGNTTVGDKFEMSLFWNYDILGGN